MNCLTMAFAWMLLHGGRIGVLKWALPFPHFAVFYGADFVHWYARDDGLPWWRQLHHVGTYRCGWCGEATT